VDGEAFAGEEAGDELAELGIVVDDEEAVHGRPKHNTSRRLTQMNADKDELDRS
jgi:hypothetical protein